LKLNATVLSSLALTESRYSQTPEALPWRPFFSLKRLKVKATSLAVNGWPSDQFTPSRVVKVSFLSPSLHLYSVPSHGTYSPLIELNTISGSYMASRAGQR
jgi:hypothetical protein